MQGHEYFAGVLLAMSTITLAIRAFPFLFSRWLKSQPLITYLGKALPPAIVVLLVFHCLKDVAWSGSQHGVVELSSIAVAVSVHLIWRNFLLSLVGGTGTYMFISQYMS